MLKLTSALFPKAQSFRPQTELHAPFPNWTGPEDRPIQGQGTALQLHGFFFRRQQDNPVLTVSPAALPAIPPPKSGASAYDVDPHQHQYQQGCRQYNLTGPP